MKYSEIMEKIQGYCIYINSIWRADSKWRAPLSHAYLPQTLQANSGKGPSPFGTPGPFVDGGFADFVAGRLTLVGSEEFESPLSGFAVVLTFVRFGSDGFMKLKGDKKRDILYFELGNSPTNITRTKHKKVESNRGKHATYWYFQE